MKITPILMCVNMYVYIYICIIVDLLFCVGKILPGSVKPLAALTGSTCICFVPAIFGYAGGCLSEGSTTGCKITLV